MILFITGCFHLYRGAPADGVFFLAAAIWLAVVETRSPAALVAGHAPASLSGPVVGALLGYAAVLALVPRYGRADVVLVGGIGLAGVAVAGTRGDTVPPRRRGAAWPYALVGLVAALNELTAYLLGGSTAAEWRHPSLSDLLDPAWAWGPTRAVLAVGWLAAGLFLMRLLPARVAEGTEPERQEGTS